MDKYFDFIMFYGKDNVFVRKLESGMFDYVIEKFNLNLNETLSIGDRTIDYIASKKNNLPVCLFNAIYDKQLVTIYIQKKRNYQKKWILKNREYRDDLNLLL